MDTNQCILEALKIATDTKAFELGEHLLHRAPILFQEHFPGRKAVIIADRNTWNAAGEAVFGYMQAAGVPCECHLIEEEEFHADWPYVERLDNVLDRTGAVAVAVGSGVINDLCKLASFHHGQSYMCVATAASVDGYSSSGAVVTQDGAKINVETHAPLVILADVNVLAAAPKEMTAAGYADLAAKVPAGAEWMIADLFGTEPIQPAAWHVLQDVLDDLIADPAGTAAGNPDAIASLFAGLTLSGIAMQAAKSSRPASCTEHLFSHVLDMTHHRYKGKFQSHGFQVAVGTLTMCAFFDEFFKMDLSTLDVDACVAAWPTLEEEQQRAIALFKDFPVPMLGYTEITKKYNDRDTVRVQLTRVKENWPDFKAKLQAQCYTFEKMRALFAAAGAPTDPEQIGVSRRQLRSMVDLTQLLRWRINLLDLAKRAGIYDKLVARVFGKGGAWEID
ncbi:sn-glycerol-1-phosphate dehydrogenase [uncultured Alistipes sp.]|uniref:sn-glycerol-1-phosphate dehydrogenase n=1 Tax=uncultured Alistipes sp. TaxID=538949 RepID=UPI002638C924|nr:sn-glycerol-1-phosphate dehydrogenase [uncultured Alistipes sp.]